MTSGNSPIKRNPALVRFSRDHHHGLLLVWKIREGFRRSVAGERIAEYCAFFFDKELVPHFEDEEKNLFAKMPPENALRLKAEAEHGVMRDMADNFRSGKSERKDLENFAQLLESHIRFEERQLFNHLQEYLNEEELEQIEIAGRHASCVSDEAWHDEFWKDN